MQLLSRVALAVALTIVLVATHATSVDAQFGSPVMKRSPHRPHTGPKPPAWSPPLGHSKPPKPSKPETTTAAPSSPPVEPTAAAALPEVQQRWRGLRLSN